MIKLRLMWSSDSNLAGFAQRQKSVHDRSAGYAGRTLVKTVWAISPTSFDLRCPGQPPDSRSSIG